MVSLDRCHGSCDTLDNPSGRICLLNKRKKVNLNVFNLISRINESRRLTKHISFDCKCKLDGTGCNSN